MRGGAARASTAACARSSPRASTRSTAASAHAHIVDGRMPHSLLLELFTDAGIGTKIEAGRVSLAELQALERDARDRRPTRACPSSSCAARARGCGTPTATSTSTSSAASRCTSLGHCHPRGRRGGARAGRPADARRQPLLHRAGDAAGASGCRESSLGGKVFFCNSGAEANEAAIKLARKARPAGEIVVVHGAFHGRTYGALSATPQESKQAPFAPLVPGFVAVAPRRRRRSTRRVDERHRGRAARADPGRDAACTSLADELLRAARAACDAHGAALVFDEIQTRHGAHRARCGPTSRRACVPDAMTTAKALGGGLPIGALRDRRAARRRASQPGDHGSTFAGGPLVAAAANAALDVLEDPALLASRARAGRAAARRACARCPARRRARPRADARVRGRRRARPRAPRAARAAAVLNATGPTTVRLLPPLIVTEDEVDDALARIGRLLSASTRNLRAAMTDDRRTPRSTASPPRPRAPPPTRPTRPRSAACCCSTRAASTRA